MATELSTNTTGGKGNLGRFIERDRKVCAAGKPSAQPDLSVKGLLTQYCMEDEVNALIGDAIIPPPKVTKLPPLRYPPKRDLRHAGFFSEGRYCINPPVKTKMETLVEDFKDTSYKSYWTGAIGRLPDLVPNLPEGMNIYETVFGKKCAQENLYDVIMPVNPVPDKTPESKKVGYQVKRNYCSFNGFVTFGDKTNNDPSGKFMKCCLTDDRIPDGIALKKPLHGKQVKYQLEHVSRLGTSLTPNDNIKNVPEGHTFGIISHPDHVAECLRTCDINPYKEEINKCLEQLNTLRKCLAKRCDRNFYRRFYLNLKSFDESKTGWLPKEFVYKQCDDRYVRFNPALIEPLLNIWHAFNGSHIEYKTFVNVINSYEICPDLPKIRDVDCFDYRTTYNESFNSNWSKDPKEPMAGVPSGRYFDKEYPVTPSDYCKADRYYLPEESDVKICLLPSVFTAFGVSHRDMYAQRDKKLVRKVFENCGGKFEDGEFEKIWEIAEKFHTQRWVCFETFRRAIREYKKMHDNTE